MLLAEYLESIKGANRPLLVPTISKKLSSSWTWTAACPAGYKSKPCFSFSAVANMSSLFITSLVDLQTSKISTSSWSWYINFPYFREFQSWYANFLTQRKLTFHISQTFLPSVILIAVAGISFFVPSDQVRESFAETNRRLWALRNDLPTFTFTFAIVEMILTNNDLRSRGD